MVCAPELLNGNLLRDADFDSLFLCMAFHEIYPARAKEHETRGIASETGQSSKPGVGRRRQATGGLPASAPDLSGFAIPAYRSLGDMQ